MTLARILRLLRPLSVVLLTLVPSLAVLANVAAEGGELTVFGDRPLPEPVQHPGWFKLSFLDLAEDLEETRAAGKQGLIIYLGQKDCAYCRALLEGNWGKPDIVAYTREHFEVVAIDIHGDRSVTDFDGREMSERDYAIRQQVNFTPTLIFYDGEGRVALRLPGYYPPYKFRAALTYVAEGYYRSESFRDYLGRADVGMVFEPDGLNEEPFFQPPPFVLDRRHIPGERPLLVFFEQPDCHACDILHTGPLADPRIRGRLGSFDVVQLGIWDDTPLITPDGRRTRARDWAAELGLFYAPSLLFFDERGREILRVDSVVQFYRLRNVLDYVLSRAYERYPTFQAWRKAGSP